MNKENIIPKYFKANLAFYNFLSSYDLFDTNDYASALLAPGYLSAVKLSIISNMFLSIKESIISKERKKGYTNKIFMERLDEIVLTITKKVDDRYFLDEIAFDNPMEVVSFIRNRLAHGLYLIDFDTSQVILIDSASKKEVRLSIDKLSIFAISGILGYLDGEISSSITRRIIRNMDLDLNRRNPLNSELEVLEMIKKFSVISINIKKKDDNYISLDDRIFFDNEIEHFGKKEYLEILQEKMKDKYEITYSDRTIDEEAARKIAPQVFSVVGDMADYQEQARVILFQIGKIINSDRMIGYTNTLKLLNVISRVGTIEWKHILDKVDGELLIDYDVFANSELAMFNALFIYGMDDILTDNEAINDMIIKKIDYSMLDLSLIKITNINLERGQIKSLREQSKSVNKRVKDKYKNMEEKFNLPEDVSNNEKQNNILGTYNELNEEIISLIKRKEVLDKKIKYYDSNSGIGQYFYNRAIIEGIRNSIAHGNYQIKFDDNTTKIIFKSIDNGVEVFSCEVSISDFVKVLYDAYFVVNEYLDSIKDKSIKKK